MVSTPENELSSRQTLILWIGAAFYALSFFFVAVTDGNPVQGSNPSMPGWMCAVYSLVLPVWTLVNGAPGHGFARPIAWVALFVTGLINPVFIATFANVLYDRQHAVSILRIVLVVMLLCSGMVFYTFGLYPREGFLIWVLGMLLVVSAAELAAAMVGR